MPDLHFLDWPAPPNVKACFTLRTGGESQPPYNCFNVGDHVGDCSDTVNRHRSQLPQAIKVQHISWLQQVHSTQVIDAEVIRIDVNDAVKADASTTKIPNIACCVMTADCLPVFFCDQAGTQVAVAHAGWRGLLDGVLENTVSRFASPANVLAYLGPAISQAAFEVGAEVRGAFVEKDSACEVFFIPSQQGGKWMADLYGIARHRLSLAGVTQCYGGDRCTYTEPESFFSYRRDTITGRMANLIWLQ